MKIWIIFILIVAGCGGWWFYHHRKADPIQYQTIGVNKGDITQTVTATGTLNPVVNVQVGSQISGNIYKLYADFNSAVKANQVVAEVDPASYLASLHQAQGDLESAKAAAELARLTADRKKGLVDQHAAPQADLDQANATLRQASALVTMKQASVERCQVDLDHCSIRSPIDGTVISRAVDVGQTVAAAMNAPVVFTIAKDLTQMQIDTNVAEADLGMIEEGQDVDFHVDAFPYRTFHGKVQQVRNAATTVQNVVTYDVVVAVHNEDLKLKPGMTTNISVIVAHRENVLKLSNAALRYRPEAQAGPVLSGVKATPPSGRQPRQSSGNQNERTVYVLPSGADKPAPVQVKVGITDSIATEITEGLKDGDLLVVSQSGGAAAAGGPQNSNPLSGGMRFR